MLEQSRTESEQALEEAQQGAKDARDELALLVEQAESAGEEARRVLEAAQEESRLRIEVLEESEWSEQTRRAELEESLGELRQGLAASQQEAESAQRWTRRRGRQLRVQTRGGHPQGVRFLVRDPCQPAHPPPLFAGDDRHAHGLVRTVGIGYRV